MKSVYIIAMTAFVFFGSILQESSMALSFERAIQAAETQSVDAVIMADQIVIKWRIHEGKPQFRRFNATKNRWVDPEWIDA